MGAVQSGKTASMLAVAAKALDGGVDAVVILGGTRTALWTQTFERLAKNLDTLPDRLKRRVLLPGATILGPGGAMPGARTAYRLTSQLGEKVALGHRQLLVVAMKNTAHLAALATALHDAVYPTVRDGDRPFHLLVLDDEADDSSVTDDESTGADEVRQVPRRILDLWESRQRPGETVAPRVHATYIAYTATPQATFLQDPGNVLAPRDFIASLRTPGAAGLAGERTSTYRVPEGPRAWYTGAEVFYDTLDGAPLCMPREDHQEGDLIDAVRGYLVACAVRLLRDGDGLGPAAAAAARFTRQEDAVERVARPMSMLVHPSAAKDRHFELAGEILAWSMGLDADQGRTCISTGDRQLCPEGVARDLRDHHQAWVAWLTRYRRSAELAASVLGVDLPVVPSETEWATVQDLLLREVVPGTTIAVVNSDEDSDERPRFEPVQDDDGSWRAAPNLSTIFVSGNVMSRGLTLEGLMTTFFSRRTDDPLADTQMQMQRWFGYRAAYIDLCRVMLTDGQLRLFRQYHENDEALRREVLAAMSADGPLPRPSVLQGRSFRATGKISGVRAGVLWPGDKPFVRLINQLPSGDPNAEVVAAVFGGAPLLPTGDEKRRGLLLEDTFDLLSTADLLDRLTYPNHGPGLDGPDAERWSAVTKHAGFGADETVVPLYRAPSVEDGVDLGLGSPYAIAAYLRLWSGALDCDVPGLRTTDEPSKAWNLLDHQTRRERQPRFSIGVRFGGGAEVVSGPVARLPGPPRVMERAIVDGVVTSAWGSRGAGGGTRSDEQFDLQARGLDLRLGIDGIRPPGSDGLVLFHVVETDGPPAIAVGVVVPRGGPDHVRAEPGSSGG